MQFICFFPNFHDLRLIFPFSKRISASNRRLSEEFAVFVTSHNGVLADFSALSSSSSGGAMGKCADRPEERRIREYD